MASEGYKLHFEPQPTIAEQAVSGLSSYALRAMGRQVTGPNAAELLLETRSLKQFNLNDETREWAEAKLFNAAEKWQDYAGCLTTTPALDTKGLETLFPMLGSQLEHLYKVAQASSNPNAVDILMVPYAEFYKQIDTFPEWLALMRKKQSPMLNPDEIDPAIVARIKTNPATGAQAAVNNGGPAVKMDDYLAEMAEKDNGWKLMLIGEEVGLGAGPDDTPHEIRRSGSSNKLNYLKFGIMEWFAYSLQEPISTAKPIILTGSSILSPVTALVAVGSFDSDENCHELSMRPSRANWPDAVVVPSYMHE